jgi:hypothetical protein
MKNVFKNPLKVEENDGILAIVGKTVVSSYIVSLASIGGLVGALATIGYLSEKSSKEEVEKSLDELVVEEVNKIVKEDGISTMK